MDVIDFHAHIIPRADHGSSSVDVTMMQLDMARKHGINRIVATPHFYPHKENVDHFIARRNACYAQLSSERLKDFPEILLGAEVLICDNIEEMPMLKQLCVSGTKALLLELPFIDFSDSYVYSVKALIARGYTVVIAHADRYAPRDIDRLISVGARLQLNAEALCGLFIPAHIKKWLKEKRVCAIGSDIHGADKKAYARFNKAMAKLGDNAEFIKRSSESILS